MKIAVLGTGEVGRRIATKLIEVGHEVRLGSRTADHTGATAWAAEHGDAASNGTFADAAANANVVFNCTKGEHALAVIGAAGSLDGKVLVDVSNPLDFSGGFPPTLSVCNTESMAEQIQAAVPKARVVKALNTLSNEVMVNPRMLDGTHNTFLSGNDTAAKEEVRGLLRSFGWEDDEMIDLGDLSTARGTEMFLPLWVRLYGKLKTGTFNIGLVYGKALGVALFLAVAPVSMACGGGCPSNGIAQNFASEDLTGCDVSEKNLVSPNFSGADLTGVNLTNVNVTNGNFSNAKLSGANFTTAALESPNFSNADLTNANFADADLSNANFTGATLTGANFQGADLANANCTNATGGDFSGATISNGSCS